MYEVIAEKGFDLNHTKKYKLSIQVSLDGFSFSIIHPGKNRLLALQNYPAKISSEKFLGKRFSEWTGKNQILSKKYAEIKILFYTNKFTLIPAEIYTKKKGDDIFRFIFGNQSAGEIKDCYLENIPGHLYFNIPTDLEQALENTFPGYELLHPIAVLDMKIKSRLKKEKNSLILHFYKNHFLFCSMTAKKYNSPTTSRSPILMMFFFILFQY